MLDLNGTLKIERRKLHRAPSNIFPPRFYVSTGSKVVDFLLYDKKKKSYCKEQVRNLPVIECKKQNSEKM